MRNTLLAVGFSVIGAPIASAAHAAVAPHSVVIGGMPKLPVGAVRTGILGSRRRITIGIALSVRHPQALALAASTSAVANGSMPRITPAQFAATYAPSAATISRVDSGLRSIGLRPGAASPNGLVIPVTATVGRLERAFGSRIDAVRLPEGSAGWAPESAPLIPAAIAPNVSAVLGLSNLDVPQDHLSLEHQARPLRVGASARTADRVTAAPRACDAATSDASSAGGWTDNDIAKAYGLDHLYAHGDTGAGQTIAVFELEPFALSDVATFDRCYFGESHTEQISVEPLDGFGLTGQGDGEAILDVEDISALAPSARIDVYEAPNTSFGAVDEYNAIVSEDNANVVTTSWGECESALDAGSPGNRGLENVIFEEAALQGQTVVAASGDDGSDDCANTQFGSSTAVKPYLSVDDPASQPYVLAVGGTSLDSIRQPLTARSETVWNNGSAEGAAGGGVSINWPSPAWQSGSGVPGVSSSSDREVPDVAASADQSRGITIFSAAAPPPTPAAPEGAQTGGVGWSTIGGTSSAAPIWAAILADIAASGPAGTTCGSLPVNVGGADLGFVPPDLYDVARLDYGAAFHDISLGNNDTFGLGDGYDATAGYDIASGLGSPIVVGTHALQGLASDLCSVATGSALQLPSRPVVTGLSPVAGSTSGGAPVTISLATAIPTGVAVAVEFGPVRATVLSSTGETIVVDAPTAQNSPGAPIFGGAGPVAVTVLFTGPSGVAANFPTATSRYEYVAVASDGGTAPTVTGVGPSGGAPGGGGRIVIYGSGFASSPDSVTIGGVPAGGVVVVNDHELTATIPALTPTTSCATGTGFDPADDCETQVVVSNAEGPSPTSTISPALSGPIVFTPQGIVTAVPGTEIAPAATEYDYSPVPVVTSVSPDPAGAQGTAPVTITGAGFSLDTFEWVNFGPAASPDSEQLKILSITGTTITIDPPPAPSNGGGLIGGGISVSTTAGVSNPLPFGYAGIPVVRSISTHLGPTIGGTKMTVTGHGFTGVTSVNFVSAISVVRFGESMTRTVVVLNPTHLEVVAPAGLGGVVQVEPCTPTGCAVSSSPEDQFEYFSLARPEVTSSSPPSGGANGGTVVTVLGNNLAGAVAVRFGPRSSSSFVNAEGFPPGGPDALAVHAPPGKAGATVQITVVTRAGATKPVANASYTYVASVPSSPRKVTASPATGGVIVHWVSPLSDGGGEFAAYLVTAMAPGGVVARRTVSPAARSVLLRGLPSGGGYSVTVVAMNTDGAVGTAATAIMGIDGRAKSLGRLRTGTSRGAHSE